MSRIRQIPAALIAALLVAAGVAATLAGVYLLAGAAWALVVGGCTAATAGLLVDVD